MNLGFLPTGADELSAPPLDDDDDSAILDAVAIEPGAAISRLQEGGVMGLRTPEEEDAMSEEREEVLAIVDIFV